MNSNPEKRVNTRQPWNEDIDIIYSGTEPSSLKTITARTFDISSTGIGIIIPTILKKGHIILFAKNQEKWQLPDKGVVIWSFKNGSNYKVGLEFLL